MGVTDNTALLATKNDIITALVQRELAFSAKILPTVTDVSSFAQKGMKSIAFPKFGTFTVENRASGVAATLQNLTGLSDRLDLLRRATVSWLVDPMDQLQSSVDVQAEYVKRAATSHARDVDTSIVAVLESDAGLDVGATPLTQDLILTMREYLMTNNADMNNLNLLIHPQQEHEMLNINNFVQAFAYGGQGNIPSGVIGRVFGVPVMVSNAVAPSKCYMYDKSAVAIGFQKGPQYDEVKSPQYGSGAILAIIDQLYGVKSMFTGQEGAAAGKSPLIVKI